jgi:hypothetical protein
MIKLRSLPRYVLASALLLPAFAPGQAVAPTVRIVSHIDESQLVTLKGNTNYHANAKNDRGAVGDDFAMPDLTLVLSRSAEQEAAFEAYIESQYDSASPNFHQWLTPTLIGEQFGPAQADIATVTSWLASHGFAIKSVAPDRMTIRFSGTAGQVQSAFHTEIHNLAVNGVPHYANMSDPQIPAALSTVVVGVKALHNFLPHAMHREVGQAKFDKQSGHWQHIANATTASTLSSPTAALTTKAMPGLRPEYGINGSSNGSAFLEEDVTPWDFATIYNVIPAWNAGYTGSGQTIAIAGTSLIAQSNVGSTTYSGSGTVRSVSGNDVATFRSDFGLPALSSFQQIDTDEGPTATKCTSTSASSACGIGDLDENTLDVEWSGSVATGASVVLVVTGQNSAGTIDTVYDSAQYVVQNQIAKILNVSYGECELGQGTSANVLFYNLWQSAAAEGISVFVAAGDSGAPSCDDGGDSIGWPYSAQYGLSVSGLASTPYNVAVGGTDFSWCKPTISSSGVFSGCPTSSSSQGSPAYWATSNNTSTEPYESALGYVPEVPWNDSCLNPILSNYLSSFMSYLGYGTASNAEAACDKIQNDWYAIAENKGYVLAYYIDTIGGSGGASNCVVNDGSDVSSCTTTAGSSTTGSSYGNIPIYNDGWVKPSWQVSAESTVGVPADGVRDLPDVSLFAADGALDSAYVVCISANGSCTYPSTSEETYEEFGGTSFGSPEMAGIMALINQKAGAAQGLPLKELYTLAGEQTYSSCSAEGPPASTCYFHSIDEGTNAMPCDRGASIGGVYYNGGWYLENTYTGSYSTDCTALNSGDTVGTLYSSTTPVGVGYNAVAGYNMATGLGTPNVYNIVNSWVSDVVGTASSTMKVQLSATTLSAATPLTVTVTMTGSGSYGTPTGTITVTGGGYSGSQAISSGQAIVSIPASSLAPGSVTLTVYYSGDTSYAAQSTTESITVTAVTPTVTVTAPASDNIANAVNVSVTVSGPTTPTGTVTLQGGSYTSTAVTLVSGVASFTIPAGDLLAGSDTLTANYSGSSNYYSSAQGQATINIVNTATLAPTVTVSPSPTTPDSSQSLTVTVTVSDSSSAVVPTGYVTLTTTGGYSSGLILLSGGTTKITILGNTLAAGTVTLTAAYSGDATYAAGTGTNTVTVTQSTYSLTASTPSAVSPGATASSTVGGSSSSSYYTGTVTLSSCTLTSSSVTNPEAPPSCSVSGTITFSSGTPSGTGTATVSTYDEVAGNQARPNLPGGKGWLGAGAGTVLALLVFFGIPARRRSWRNMLSILIATVTLGALASCGGSTNTSTSGNSYVTQAGTYTFTVTGSGTGSGSSTVQETTTFTVTVN